MAARTRSILVGLTGLVAPLALSACGAPRAEVSDASAVQALTVADQTWSCPKDVAFLESLQTAYEHLEGRPATSLSDLEAIGFTEPTDGLAATFTDGDVVGTTSERCSMESFTDLDLDPRCAEELDRLYIDVIVGFMVAQHLGSSLGSLAQARAVGVDHGPYPSYTWDDLGWRPVPTDPTCPDEAALYEALDRSTNAADEDPCVAERKTLETATEAYVAQTGGPPVDERALVDAGFLRAEMDGFDLAPDGSVVPAPGSACA